MMGTSRRIDQLGRVLVPVEIRKMLGIRNGDTLEMRVENGTLVLEKVRPECALCGSDEHLVSMHNTYVCATCVDQIRTKPECAICGRVDNLTTVHDRHVCEDCVRELTVA
jgi:transcriptional pleiotropic regulator of transition state genes